jgi:hypothetical protein
MCKTLASFLFLVAILDMLAWNAAAAEPKSGATIFVALQGNDAWSGTLAKPNAAKTNGPLATLQAARDRIRAMKANGPLPAGGVSVVLGGGTYFLPKTFKLDRADSGTAEAPTVYCAAKGQKVRIVGGRPIAGFTPYRGSILKANVATQGFKGGYFRQLFFDGRRQHLARYPNFDPQNPYGGGWAYVDGRPIAMSQNVPGESRRMLQYKKTDARQWSHPQEGEVFVFPRFNWWNNIVSIATIDHDKRMLTLRHDASYPIRPGDRYYVQNLLEELDAPGEWYLDRRTQTLYFWPPAPMKGKTVYAPTMRTLIEIGQGVSHLTIRGLALECCEGTAVLLKGTEDCLIAGNTISNVGDYSGSGVSVVDGKRNGVVGNDIYEVGHSAIMLTGGDRVTLTSAENYADNNYIHHTGVFYKQGVGVWLEGVGNRATHNLIHDCPRFGIFFAGNNLRIEYNHIRHANLETADTGAVYTGGRDWISSRGTCIRYNYFHDILGYGQENGHWVSPHYAWGIYLDDNAGGVDIIGNIVARTIRGLIHLHNGRDNLIENNILIDATLQQYECNGWHENSRPWKDHLPTMIRGYQSVAGQPAWQNMRHMELEPSKAPLADGLIMANNVLRRNIFYYHDPKAKLFQLANFPLDHNQSDYNLAYHFGQPLEIHWQAGKSAKTPYSVPRERDAPIDHWPRWWQAQGLDRHSLVGDPLFVNADKGDYRLRAESPALKLGFRPIPVEKIGPYADSLRASWPIREAEGVREKPLVSKE